jgi:hypothetical protein
MPIEQFSRHAELDDEVAREILRLDFAPFSPPKADEGGLVVAHNDPGVGAADEAAPRIPRSIARCLHDCLS